MKKIPVQTDIKVTPECRGSVIQTFHVVFVTIDLQLSLVALSQVEFREKTTGEEESSAVSSSVVGEPDLDSVSRELM